MIQLLAGDCRDVLPTLAADSVQCCVCSPPYYALRSYLPDGHADKHREIGSEATPDEYLATMVAVFREVKRVLRPDGTCWVNMGDSYAGPSNGYSGDAVLASTQSRNQGAYDNGRRSRQGKPKDLLMMPARLALALQADGWWLRSQIVWHKPNPMPESVSDRPTSAYEMVYLLTKRSRYYYDADAVREEGEGYGRSERFRGDKYSNMSSFNNSAELGITQGGGRASFEGGRNLRNVWTIATHAYPQAHFATYPPELAERCIRAGTSERGACSQCGAPWGRVVERISTGKSVAGPKSQAKRDAGLVTAFSGYDDGSIAPVFRTTGWHPSCRCGTPETRPCTVLDPFAGAGTTLLVADRLQRDAIGIELNPDYTRMAMQRCQDDAPLFTSFPPAETDAQDERMRDLFADAEYHRAPASTPKVSVPSGWDTGPGAHGTIHRTGRTVPEAAD